MIIDRNIVTGLILLGVLATLPFWLLTTNYTMSIAIHALMFVALALAWNIISGIGGQLSLGHALFFGIGAYTSSLLFISFGISPWFGMVVGALLAGIAGVAMGYPSFRLSGVYFKLITFVIALIAETLVRYFDKLTGGDVGLNIPLLRDEPAMYQFGSPLPYFYLILVIAALYFVVTRAILRGRFGLYLQALRDDQTAAETLGVNSMRVKLMGFALSAALTALIGTFYAQYTLFIDPASTFGMFLSIKIALAAIAGGVGTLWGPVVGGLFLIPLAEWANAQFEGTITGVDLMIYGFVMVLLSIYLPGGLRTLPERLRAWRRVPGKASLQTPLEEDARCSRS